MKNPFGNLRQLQETPPPLHHDLKAAEASRFGKLIAAGSQVATTLSGVVASNLWQLTPSLGLEMNFRFRRAVIVDEPHLATWEVMSIEADTRLGGDVVLVKCRLENSAGRLAAEGDIVSLVTYDGHIL